jgi:hypothetical protein
MELRAQGKEHRARSAGHRAKSTGQGAQGKELKTKKQINILNISMYLCVSSLKLRESSFFLSLRPLRKNFATFEVN